jgi:hypothetical protein
MANTACWWSGDTSDCNPTDGQSHERFSFHQDMSTIYAVAIGSGHGFVAGWDAFSRAAEVAETSRRTITIIAPFMETATRVGV